MCIAFIDSLGNSMEPQPLTVLESYNKTIPWSFLYRICLYLVMHMATESNSRAQTLDGGWQDDASYDIICGVEEGFCREAVLCIDTFLFMTVRGR